MVVRDPGIRSQWNAAAVPLTHRVPRLAACGLALAAVLPPLALAARPGDGDAAPVSLALIGVLLLAPAAVGLVAALCGIGEGRDDPEFHRDHEHEQAVLRVFVCLGMFAYGFAMALARPGDAAVAASRVVAALGLAGAWVLLLWAVADPAPSLLRRTLAAFADAVLLSAFLAVGGAAMAPWFPLYLLANFYAGFRFGPMALATQASLGLAGFTVAVALTPFWRTQPLLTSGLVVALAALPVSVAGMMRAVRAARAEAAAAQAERTRFLTTIGQALRAPLEAIVGVAPAAPEAAPAARALLSRVGTILDLTAIEAGAFAPATEAFDLHRILNDALAEHRAEAAAKGGKLRLSIDPALPYRLIGWPQQLRQIVDCLVAHALDAAPTGIVRVAVDAADSNGRTLDLRLAVRDHAAVADPPAEVSAGEAPFALSVATRLAELMGGRIAAENGMLAAIVPLRIDEPAVDRALDLAGSTVLIAAEDNEFAGDLAARVTVWHGDPRRIAGFDGALQPCDPDPRTVLIVDGRTRPLAALSFAHRAVNAPAPPACVLFVAMAAQTGGIGDLAEGELDGILPAPFDEQLLANALRALPLPPAAAAPITGRARQVTPIATHPHFAAETATVDARVIAGLRGLDSGDAFLAEIIDSFRGEAGAILDRLAAAAAVVDVPGFVRGLNALRGCAASLGGTRLCELLLSLRGITAAEIRDEGGPIVQRLGDEVGRLDAALADYLPAPMEAQG